MKNQAKIIIDNRNTNDILNEIKRLSEAYTPEWNFETNNPDIASTIGIIYAEQLAENVERVNSILDIYHTEFVNLLDISIHPSTPAQSVVLMELAQDTIDGVMVPASTRLLGESGASLDSEPVVFETMDNTYVTNSKIKNIFMTDMEHDSLFPILGEIKVPELLSNAPIDALADNENEINTDNDNNKDIIANSSFVLFGEHNGVGKHALLIYHGSMFGNDGNIYLRLEGNERLIERILKGELALKYVCDGLLTPVEDIELMSDLKTLSLKTNKPHTLQKLKDGEYGMLALINDNASIETEYVDSIKISAKGEKAELSFVGNDNHDMNCNDFMPFSNVIGLYQECYFGHDTYFNRAGSRIYIEFDLSFEEKLELLTPKEEEEELKIIKRKPKNMASTIPADVYANEIWLSYYNGVGYKNLEFEQESRYIFSKANSSTIRLSFICPNDWKDNIVAAYEGKSIRMQVLRADNCYMRPALHYAPRIKNFRVSFEYDSFSIPEKIFAISGTKKNDITAYFQKEEKYPVFSRAGYEDALFLGLDSRPEKGPVSIFIRLEEGKRYNPIKCSFEYSSRNGFKALKVIDGTASMSKSGLLTFIPPTDFYESELEGARRFWIKIVREHVQSKDDVINLMPVVLSVNMNGIRVQNTDTKREEDYYLDEITPYARFSIPYDGILSCDVWVNEFGTISEAEMKRLEEINPLNVKTEYDVQGYRRSFFVRWKEIERFELADDRRVYVLDRLSKEILFGDGINTDIPRVTSDVSLRITTRTSNGALGNVEIGSINSSISNLIFIGDIYNPIKAYGGNNMETVESAMQRGANIISSRHRLVSATDYVREIKAYSNLIEQVVCLNGYTNDGQYAEGNLSIILLLKDYKDGSFTFHKLQEDCRKYILNSCELTIPEEAIHIIEPVFVNVSVMVWIRANKIEDSFEIQSNLMKMLDEYLDPISKDGHKGWKIGSLPSESQIMMKINSFKQEAIVENVAILVNYSDFEGNHEADIKEFKMESYMVCCSGKHQIHVEI